MNGPWLGQPAVLCVVRRETNTPVQCFEKLFEVNMSSLPLVDPKTSPSGINIGIMTSGGDAQGMNAAIRSVVRRASVLGASVWAIYEGYMGMVNGGDMIRNLKWDDVSGLLPKVRILEKIQDVQIFHVFFVF